MVYQFGAIGLGVAGSLLGLSKSPSGLLQLFSQRSDSCCWALSTETTRLTVHTPLLTDLQHYKGKYCIITAIIFCVSHLASFARSSVTSRVSCRFMSSHCATLLSRLLFCSFSFRWACFSSATVSNKSLSSLKPEQWRQLVVWWQTWNELYD